MLVRMATDVMSLSMNGTYHVRMMFRNPAQTKERAFQATFLQFLQDAIHALVNAHFIMTPIEVAGDEVTVVPVFDVECQDIHNEFVVSLVGICFKTLAGLPAAIVHAGTSLVTKEPAPTMAPSPMVTPGIINDSIPTKLPFFK